jgi:tetratricopeptide (TPR) repeat protein
LLRVGLSNDALIEFRKLTEVAPEAVEGFRGMAEALLALDRLEESDAVLVRGGQAFPKDPGLTLTRGRLALRSHNYEDARSYFLDVGERRDAYEVEALAWLSLTELVSGDARAALATANRALAINPEQPLPCYALAVVLDETGDPKAGAWLRRALRLDPGNRELQHRIARRR